MSENKVAKRDESALDQFRDMDITRPSDAAAILVQSGYFPDVRSMSQAAVKIMAGHEIGLTPFASMQGIDIVKGNVRMRSVLLAAKVKDHPDFDYRVTVLTNNGCEIVFREKIDGKWEDIGTSSFTIEDAKTAGLLRNTVWKSYPRNMCHARAMSNGVNMFCPNVAKGIRVYDESDSFGPSRPAPTTTMEDLDADLGVAPKLIEQPAEKVIDAEPAQEMSDVAREFFKDVDEDGFR